MKLIGDARQSQPEFSNLRANAIGVVTPGLAPPTHPTHGAIKSFPELPHVLWKRV